MRLWRYVPSLAQALRGVGVQGSVVGEPVGE